MSPALSTIALAVSVSSNYWHQIVQSHLPVQFAAEKNREAQYEQHNEFYFCNL